MQNLQTLCRNVSIPSVLSAVLQKEILLCVGISIVAQSVVIDNVSIAAVAGRLQT